jgi:RNA polymerase sigma factor (sigma-70 family)
MQDLDDLALLREYAANHSEAAFEELVSRHIGFVYSSALRQTRDPNLAEEITQAVFIILAQKAGRISDKTILTGWLFKTTRFAALAQMRAEMKRSLRTATIEKEFQMQNESQSAATDEIWNQMSPLLDEALAALGETDRQAVLLRFFENKSLAEIGNYLGAGEDTARKRVTRALGKLHRFFSKRGVSSTTAIIAGAISANSVQAAPVALAKSIVVVAIGKGSIAATSTLALVKGTMKIMTWMKLKFALGVSMAALLTAGTITVVLSKNDSAIPPAISVGDLSATNILTTVKQVYASLSTYRDTGWAVHSYKEDAWTNNFSETLGARTYYRVEIITAPHPYSFTNRFWSDGLDNYSQQATPTIFKGLDLAGNLSSTANDTAVPTIYFNLSWGNVFVPFLLGPENELVRQDDEKVGSVDCYVVSRTNALNQVKLWIGKRDFLIRRYQHNGNLETHENIFVNEEFKREDFIPKNDDK